MQTFKKAGTFFGKVKEYSKYLGLSVLQFLWLYPIATESFCVYDGDTVTVLGHLTYDTHLDCFEVKSPISLWLGDKADYLQSLLGLEITASRNSMFAYALSGSLFILACTSYYFYSNYER